MGSAALATPGRAAGAEFPHSAASVAAASENPRRAGAAAPTTAPAPRLRRRFLRESGIADLLIKDANSFPSSSLRELPARYGRYLNALRRESLNFQGSCVRLRTLPSGSWNQATLAPPGALQMTWAS